MKYSQCCKYTAKENNKGVLKCFNCHNECEEYQDEVQLLTEIRDILLNIQNKL